MLKTIQYGLLGAAAVGALGAHVAEAQPFFNGAKDPSFTEAQVAHGKTVYREKCASCHGAGMTNGEFGPALVGPAFKDHWSSQSSEALVNYIRTKMPPSEPGTLSGQSYVDLQAYILATNEVPASGGGRAAPPPPDAARAAASVLGPGGGPPRGAPPRDAAYKAAVAERTAKLEALTPVTDAMLKNPSPADWLIWRRTYQTTGFTPLAQVNKTNVSKLRQAWSWSLPVSQNETTPLVHDGVMFVESGATVEALDAATGDLLWQHVRPLPDVLANGRNWRAKTMAIYQDKLYLPTSDGHLVALETKTGKLVFDHEVVTTDQSDRKGGAEGVAVQMTGGPIVAKGKIVIGVSLGQNNAKGGDFIVSLDAQTGKELWRFYTIARPGQPGGDSWNGAPLDERYGAGVWTAGSYDPDLNLVYFGTGNTYDTGTLMQSHAQKGESNDALYTDSTLALDVDTGKLVWFFQHQNRDIWDLDWVFEQTLATLPVNGKLRNAVVTGGKIAVFDAVDRATGQYLFSRDVGLQNVVTGIDPKTGKKTTNPALEPQPGKFALLCPGGLGARNWPTTSFNPRTNILYVPLYEACMGYSWGPRSPAETAAGGSDIINSPMGRPNHDGKFGRVQAINLATGKTVWTVRQRAPMSSSMLATGGGLVFNGSLDRRFHAYDEATGKILWQIRLNAAPSSSPVSYTVDGRQYVALVTGGGGPLDAVTRSSAPEMDSPAPGITVVVFKLPDPEDAEAP